MRRGKICLTAALLALLCACLAPGGEEQDGLFLWFATPDFQQTTQVSSALDVCPYEGEKTVPALLEALLAGPEEDAGLASPIPPGVELVEWKMDGRVAEVELSPPYGELSGIDRTLADACVALTLAQADGVDGVRIRCGGREDWRVLRAEDVLFSGAEDVPVDVPVTLYFRREGGNTLDTELRVFRLTEEETPAKAVLEALIAGPQTEGLTALLPPSTAVLSAGLDDGVCYANLSFALVEDMPEGETEQRLVILSIVETLCSLDKVEQVQIMVEGQLLERYGGQEVAGPLHPSP